MSAVSDGRRPVTPRGALMCDVCSFLSSGQEGRYPWERTRPHSLRAGLTGPDGACLPSGYAVLSGSAEVLMLFWDSVWQQGRFNQMSEQIITKIDEMGSRIDDLERSISELMTQVRDVSLYIRVPVCLAKTDRNHSSPMLVWPSVCVKAGVEGPEQDILGGEQGSQHQQIGDGK